MVTKQQPIVDQRPQIVLRPQLVSTASRQLNRLSPAMRSAVRGSFTSRPLGGGRDQLTQLR